jgi:hypothetical protein
MMANIFWPETDDLWSAKKACIQGSSVALLIGIVTGVLAYMSLRGTQLFPGVSGGSFIDSAIFLILSFFVYRCSRIAAISTLLLYLYGQALLFQQTHRAPMSAILFGLLLIGGIRGAFAFHELKNGLSAEEVKATLKKRRGETTPQVSLTRRIVAWTVLIALASGGYWWYRSATHRPAPHMILRDSAQKTQGPDMTTAAGSGAGNLRPSTTPSSEKRVFRLKDGRAITGRVVTDDPVYYTVETSGGRQELVIKEDVAS